MEPMKLYLRMFFGHGFHQCIGIIRRCIRTHPNGEVLQRVCARHDAPQFPLDDRSFVPCSNHNVKVRPVGWNRRRGLRLGPAQPQGPKWIDAIGYYPHGHQNQPNQFKHGMLFSPLEEMHSLRLQGTRFANVCPQS